MAFIVRHEPDRMWSALGEWAIRKRTGEEVQDMYDTSGPFLAGGEALAGGGEGFAKGMIQTRNIWAALGMAVAGALNRGYNAPGGQGGRMQAYQDWYYGRRSGGGGGRGTAPPGDWFAQRGEMLASRQEEERKRLAALDDYYARALIDSRMGEQDAIREELRLRDRYIWEQQQDAAFADLRAPVTREQELQRARAMAELQLEFGEVSAERNFARERQRWLFQQKYAAADRREQLEAQRRYEEMQADLAANTEIKLTEQDYRRLSQLDDYDAMIASNPMLSPEHKAQMYANIEAQRQQAMRGHRVPKSQERLAAEARARGEGNVDDLIVKGYMKELAEGVWASVQPDGKMKIDDIRQKPAEWQPGVGAGLPPYDALSDEITKINKERAAVGLPPMEPGEAQAAAMSRFRSYEILQAQDILQKYAKRAAVDPNTQPTAQEAQAASMVLEEILRAINARPEGQNTATPQEADEIVRLMRIANAA